MPFIFSKYVTSFEKKVDKFFRHVKSTDDVFRVRKKLLALMQENLIEVNIWLERKFKGYRYLKKSVRREMYENAGKIVVRWREFEQNMDVKLETLKVAVSESGHEFPSGDEEKVLYLYKIMAFLKPGGAGKYHYIQTASFGKLLRDPAREMIEGDCNQIVTLYIYLYSLKFQLEDLNIKLLPKHVCLHFRGIDIEATAGIFQKYSDGQVLPVTEIISTNLLDLADFREELQSISPREMVKSSQLAYAISSLRPLVEKNLKIAYQNLGVAAMQAGDFSTAKFYFQKMGDRELLKTVKRNEAVYWFKKDSFDKAAKLARSSGDRELEKSCYAGAYNKLAKKVMGVKTLEQAKKHKSTYVKMLDLARKIGDPNLESGIRTTLGQL